jgi:hypothetical protein
LLRAKPLCDELLVSQVTNIFTERNPSFFIKKKEIDLKIIIDLKKNHN